MDGLEQNPVLDKLSDDKFGDLEKREDDDKDISGRLKGPFEGKDHYDDNNKRNI